MRWLGRKKVKLASLRLPGDLQQRLQSQSVKDIAASIDQTGGRAINVPVLNAADERVVCGRDRLAAHYIRKDVEVEVELVGATEAEMKLLETAENACRRHGHQADLRAAYLEASARVTVERDKLAAARRAAEASSAGNNAGGNSATSCREIAQCGRGRPKSPEKAHREAVASQLGVSDRQLLRDIKKARGGEEPAPAPEPRLRRLGLAEELVAPVETNAACVQDALDAADRLMRQVQARITECQHFIVNATYQRLYRDAHALAAAVRAARPVTVCPHCKLTRLQDGCTGCDGLGWLSVEDFADTDPALLAEGPDAGVFESGKWRSLTSLLDEAENLTIPGDLFS